MILGRQDFEFQARSFKKYRVKTIAKMLQILRLLNLRSAIFYYDMFLDSRKSAFVEFYWQVFIIA